MVGFEYYSKDEIIGDHHLIELMKSQNYQRNAGVQKIGVRHDCETLSKSLLSMEYAFYKLDNYSSANEPVHAKQLKFYNHEFVQVDTSPIQIERKISKKRTQMRLGTPPTLKRVEPIIAAREINNRQGDQEDLSHAYYQESSDESPREKELLSKKNSKMLHSRASLARRSLSKRASEIMLEAQKEKEELKSEKAIDNFKSKVEVLTKDREKTANANQPADGEHHFIQRRPDRKSTAALGLMISHKNELNNLEKTPLLPPSSHGENHMANSSKNKSRLSLQEVQEYEEDHKNKLQEKVMDRTLHSIRYTKQK